ncbi:MAG: Smr/MutS family protein [Burkholderiaceae bacterium]
MGKSSRKQSKPAGAASGTDATVTTLANLKRTVSEVQRAKQEQDRLAREAFERENRAAIEQARERHLLAEEFSDVMPLKAEDRKMPDLPRLDPTPRQREQDEQRALEASLSDEIDIEQYLDTDDELSYRAPHIGPEVVPRLRRGTWKISAQLDLHGLRRDEARDVLVAFLVDCQRQNNRCVRVIHGKGLGSVNREPVLKGKVRKWLVQRAEVLAFCQAPPNDGGGGALLVLLAGTGKG